MTSPSRRLDAQEGKASGPRHFIFDARRHGMRERGGDTATKSLQFLCCPPRREWLLSRGRDCHFARRANMPPVGADARRVPGRVSKIQWQNAGSLGNADDFHDDDASIRRGARERHLTRRGNGKAWAHSGRARRVDFSSGSFTGAVRAEPPMPCYIPPRMAARHCAADAITRRRATTPPRGRGRWCT